MALLSQIDSFIFFQDIICFMSPSDFLNFSLINKQVYYKLAKYFNKIYLINESRKLMDLHCIYLYLISKQIDIRRHLQYFYHRNKKQSLLINISDIEGIVVYVSPLVFSPPENGICDVAENVLNIKNFTHDLIFIIKDIMDNIIHSEKVLLSHSCNEYIRDVNEIISWLSVEDKHNKIRHHAANEIYDIYLDALSATDVTNKQRVHTITIEINALLTSFHDPIYGIDYIVS
jgi:hypothetical protein